MTGGGETIPPINLDTLIIYAYLALSAVICYTLREFIRSLASRLMGDISAAQNGGLSLNPLKRLDALGFVMTLIFRYGWGKPAHTAPVYYRNRRLGVLFTNLAPLALNALLLAVSIFLLLFVPMPMQLALFLEIFARLNLHCVIINLVPVYPMDMQRVLDVFLPPRGVTRLRSYDGALKVALVALIIILYTFLPI